MADGYNGWTNYETWAWKLWMDNDEGSYDYAQEQAREAYRDAEADGSFTRVERAYLNLADRLKEEAEEAQPVTGGVWGDMLSAALSEINWHEIASHMIDDVKDEIDEEEAETTDEDD